ncbi:MAG: tRNA epoxyqueuosine(34) reductase QueG, partial [Bacteroidota bacterium]
WNRLSKPNSDINFTRLPEVLHFTKNDWEELTEESFKIIFKNSPLKRSKFNGIKRNLKFLQS